MHKETSKLINQYDIIYIEDLNVAGMLKNRKLSKAVADVGMFELKRELEYKAAWYDKDVIMISRWEPSTKKCSNCAQIKEMKLSERIYACDSCDFIAERDLNAALCKSRREGGTWSGISTWWPRQALILDSSAQGCNEA